MPDLIKNGKKKPDEEEEENKAQGSADYWKNKALYGGGSTTTTSGNTGNSATDYWKNQALGITGGSSGNTDSAYYWKNRALGNSGGTTGSTTTQNKRAAVKQSVDAFTAEHPEFRYNDAMKKSGYQNLEGLVSGLQKGTSGYEEVKRSISGTRSFIIGNRAAFGDDADRMLEGVDYYDQYADYLNEVAKADPTSFLKPMQDALSSPAYNLASDNIKAAIDNEFAKRIYQNGNADDLTAHIAGLKASGVHGLDAVRSAAEYARTGNTGYGDMTREERLAYAKSVKDSAGSVSAPKKNANEYLKYTGSMLAQKAFDEEESYRRKTDETYRVAKEMSPEQIQHELDSLEEQYHALEYQTQREYEQNPELPMQIENRIRLLRNAQAMQKQQADAEHISSVLDNDVYEEYLSDMEKSRKENKFWREDYYTDKIFGGEHLVSAFGQKAANAQISQGLLPEEADELIQKVADNESDYMTAIDWCTDEELAAFRYLWDNGSADDVVLFLDAIKADAMEREHKYAAELISGTVLGRFVTSVASVPMNLAAGVQWLSNEGHMLLYGAESGNRRLDAAEMVSEIRRSNAEKLTEKGLFNTGLLSGEWDMPGFLPMNNLGDAYQLGMSIVDSTTSALTIGGAREALALGEATVKALEAASVISLGTAAGAARYNEVLDNGGTYAQAMTASLTAAAIEAGTEFFSVDNLVNPDKARTFLQNMLMQSGIEGLEEATATISNGIADWVTAYYNGGNYAELMNMYDEMLSQGVDERTASARVVEKLFSDMVSDFIGGALSGATSMGISMTTSGISYRGNGNQKTFTQQESDALHQYAQEHGISSDTSTQKTIRKLNATVQKSVTRDLGKAATISDIDASVQRHVEQYGEGIRQTATDAAEAAITDRFAKAKTAPELQAAYDTLTAGERITPASSATAQFASKAFETRMLDIAQKTRDTESAKEAANAAVRSFRNRTGMRVTPDNSVTVVDENGAENTATIQRMNEDGQLELDDGTVIDAAKAQVSSQTEAALQVAAEKIGGKVGAVIFNQYLEAADNADVDGYSYMTGMYEAYLQGQALGMEGLEKALQKRSNTEVSETAYRLAYKLGVDKAESDVRMRDEELRKEIEKAGKGATGRIGSIDTSRVDMNTRTAKRGLTVAKIIAQALGVDVVLTQNAKNNPIEGAYVNGKITLDVDMLSRRSGETVQGAILRVAAHEMTHFIQDRAGREYLALRSFVFDHVLDAHSQEEINMQRERLEARYRRAGETLTAEQALDDMTARACEEMLLDGDILSQLFRQNASLGQKIVAQVNAFLDKLQDAIGNGKRSAEAEWMHDAVSELREKWNAALEVAAKNNKALGDSATKNTATEGGKTRYSMAGQNAENADMSALERARAMESENVSSEEIRQQTGWFKGYDGKWRFEIDDSLSKWKDAPAFEIHEDDDMIYRTAKLGDLFKHDKLFRAYPQLADITVVVQPMLFGIYGSYSRSSNSIALSDTAFEVKTERYSKFLNGGRAQRIKEIEGTPEYQEYHKFFEDDAYGDLDPTEWLAREQEAQDKFFSSELGKEYYDLQWGDAAKYIGTKYQFGFTDEGKSVLLHELQHAVQEIEGFTKGSNTNDKNYDRSAGEIEARDVQSRKDMTAEQRKNTRPDIDRTDVVFSDERSGERFALSPDVDIEEKNIKNGTDALHRMIEQAKTAENPESITEKNAMYRSDIGQIDFVWGKPGNGAKFKGGYGVSHIIAKHGEDAARKVIDVIAKGTEYDKQRNNNVDQSNYRLRLHYDGYTVVLSKSADTNHWLLTAWENDEKTAEYATGEVYGSTGATAVTPTHTRRNGVNSTVSDDSIRNPSEKSNPSGEKNSPQFSIASDADYLSVAEKYRNGTATEEETEKLRQAVEQAAKKAGYTRRLFHGSKSGGGFTVFKGWQYFTENEAYAKRYTKDGNGDGLYSVFVKADNLFDTRKAADRKVFNQYRMEYGMGELQQDGLPDWTDGYDLSEIIEENDLHYDGIVLNEGGDLVDGKPVSRGQSYVIRDSAQIKSADLVTYDDNGEVIPLSERFNPDNEDIRYSIADNETDIGESEQITDEELLWQMRLEDAPGHAQESLREYQQLVAERDRLQRKLKAIEADAGEKTGIAALSKRQLQAKIRQLEKQVRQAREQTKRTAAKREARLKNIDASSVIHSAVAEIANERQLKGYTQRELRQLYGDVLALIDNGQEAAAQELLQNGATQLARRILDQTRVVNDADVEVYDAIREFLKHQDIRVSPEIMRAIAGPNEADWNGYRAANSQRIVVTNGDTNVEDLYQQLMEIAPAFFDAQTYNLSDMADRIVTVLKDAYDNSSAIPVTETLEYSNAQYDYDVGMIYAAILEDFKGRATPIAATVADRIEAELQQRYGIQIRDLQADVAHEQRMRSDAEADLSKARRANGELVSERYALGRKISAMSEEAAAWELYWSDINKTLSRYQNRTRRLEAENAALSERNAQMRRDMRTLRAMDTAADRATASRHKAEVTKLQRQIAGLEDRMNSMLTKSELRTVVAAERAKAAKAMAAHKDQVMQNYRERKKRTELVHKIGAVRTALQKRFTAPGESTYIPVGLANSIIDVIDMIDAAPAETRKVHGELIPSKAAAKYRSANEAMQAVFEQYEGLKENEDFVWKSEYDEDTAAEIKKLVDRLKESVTVNENGQIDISKLSNADLQAVYDTLRGVAESLRNATKLMAQDSRISVYEAMERLVDETMNGRRGRQNMSKKNGNRAGELTNLNIMRAALLMSNMDEDAQLYRLWSAIEAGDERATRYVMDYNKMLQSLKSGKNELQYLDAQHKLQDFGVKDADGRTVKMTKMQLLQMLMTWEREANNRDMKHIERGFMEIRDAQSIARGDMENADRKAQVVRMTPEMYESLKEHLNDWDLSFMAAVRAYLSGTEVGAVNAVMYQLRHRTITGEKFYFPVFTDKAYLQTELEGKQDATQMFVKSPGSTKALQTNASTPIIIDGLDTVMSRHVQEIANYVGLALPIRDFAKVYNARQTSEEGVARTSAKKAIERAWGTTANAIIENNIRDVQKISRTARDNSTTTKIAGKLQSVMVRSALVGRVSVVIKQAASYQAAGSVISDRALLKHEAEILPIFIAPGSKAAQKIFAEIDAHTSLHYNRRIGMSLQEIAEEKQKMTGIRKAASYAGAWLEQSGIGHAFRNIAETINIETAIQRMDVATTAALWNACKADVNQDFRKAKQKTGTDEYWAEVTRRYEKAIRETQPMYDALHRTEESKSKSLLTATLGLFKTVPYQNKGQIKVAMAALAEANATGTKQQKQAAFKHAAKTVWANTHSAVVFSLLTLISQALRHKMKNYRDDDDELTVESVTMQVLKDTANVWASNISPIWGGLATELADRLLLGNTSSFDVFSAGAIDVLNDTVTQAQRLYNAIGDMISGEATASDLLGEIGKTALDAANYAGIPAENVWDMIRGIADNISDIDSGLFPAFNNANEKSNSVNAKRYAEAVMSGDSEKAQTVYDELWQSSYNKYAAAGMDEAGAAESATKSADSAVKTYVKKQYASGEIGREEAEKILKGTGMSGDSVFWSVDEMEQTRLHADDEEWKYNKYHDLHDAISAGSLDLDKAYAFYGQHGIKQDTVKNEVNKYVKELYLDGDIDRKTAEAYLTQWTAKDANDAYWKVDAWEAAADHEDDEDFSYARYGDLHAALDSGSGVDAAVKELTLHGVKESTVTSEIRSYVRESYDGGTMTGSKAASMLQKYGDMTAEEADVRVQYWDFQKKYPDADISEEKVAAYYDYDLTVPMSAYVTYCTKAKDVHGVDANGDGKTDSGSKKAAMMQMINSLPISNAEKDELYYLNGWAASKINEAPWH